MCEYADVGNNTVLPPASGPDTVLVRRLLHLHLNRPGF